MTAHGRQPLHAEGKERLVDLLNRHNVPWSAVSTYAVPRGGNQLILYPGLDAVVDEIEDISEILLYFNRNINPFIFSFAQFKTINADEAGTQATEYFYQRFDNQRSSVETFLKKLTPNECQSVIRDRVADTIRKHLPKGAKLVVGVSGGGDSNALLEGLNNIHDHGLEIYPVILKGIPDWDQGVPRARELCDRYDLDLKVIEEPEVRALLGIAPDSTPLIDRFEREFKGDDFEFLGTLLIRLALRKEAQEIGTPFICTGLNLEDLLCEALFRISNGLKPASFPIRTIGDVSLLYPLWLCPKRIIDGCFPKFSRENYDARYPCFSLGRNLYYSIVYSMQSNYPGFLEQMAGGLSTLSLDNPVAYTFDESLGFHVERFVPFPLRERFRRMLGTSSTRQQSAEVS